MPRTHLAHHELASIIIIIIIAIIIIIIVIIIIIAFVFCLQPSSIGDAVQGNANSRQPGPATATAAAASWQTLWGATPSWATNTGQAPL